MSTINSRTRDGHIEVLASHARPGDVYIRSIGRGPIPVPVDALRRALDIEAPQESWDDMDGGVTCAAIENETLTNQARNEQARIDHIHEQDRTIRRRNEQIKEQVKMIDNARTMAALWKETAREHIGRAEVYQEWMHAAQDKAEDGRNTWASIAKQEAERANRAEKERGITQAAEAHAIEENDRLHDDLAKAECHDCIRDAAVIREPIAPEDLTDAMADRFLDAFSRCRGTLRDALRAGIGAMPTPEPQRSEGAEQIAALLDHVPADLIGGPLTAHEARTLADHLATHGVRVTTEENR